MLLFSKVNLVSSADYRENFQRHHIIPLQLKSLREFAPLLSMASLNGFCFDDFESNGMLLPATEETAEKYHAPLHRGPHNRYNDLVIERVQRLAQQYSLTNPGLVRNREFVTQIRVLQTDLKSALELRDPVAFPLNKRDPMSRSLNFEELDQNVDLLWDATNSFH